MIGVLSIGSPTDDISRFDEFLLLIAVFQAEEREETRDDMERLSVVAEKWDRSVLEWGLPVGRFLGAENMKTQILPSKVHCACSGV